MPNDEADPNHPINRQLRDAAKRHGFATMPAPNSAAKAMNQFIRGTWRGQLTDRREPATEPAQAPATAGPVDWGAGPRGSLRPEGDMNRWIRSQAARHHEED